MAKGAGEWGPTRLLQEEQKAAARQEAAERVEAAQQAVAALEGAEDAEAQEPPGRTPRTISNP